MEDCQSGRMGLPAKELNLHGFHRFESYIFRQGVTGIDIVIRSLISMQRF